MTLTLDLSALKSYEETCIARLDPSSPRRGWWQALGLIAQCEVAARWARGEDHGKDLRAERLAGEDYGDNQ